MKRIKTVRPLDLFLFISLGITLLFFLCNSLCNGELFRKCVMSSSFLFSDFFYHIAGSSDADHMYAYGDLYVFPPFAYFLYSFFWHMLPYRDSESILNWQNYRDTDNMLVIFVVYNMLLMMLLIYCIIQYFEKHSAKYTLLMPAALLFSYPILCTSVQRGNAAFFVAVLLALAWLWMDSERKGRREASLFLIASAAGFKLTPALTGLVYLKRKDWPRALRLMLYGVIFIFVPFFFFGGLDGMRDWIHTLSGTASYIDPDKANTVSGMAKWIGLKLHIGETPSGLNEAAVDMFATVINNLFLLTSILAFFLCRKKWQEALFLSGVIASYLPSNWQYALVYYLPVLLQFYREYDGPFSLKDKKQAAWVGFHTAAFAMVFSMDFLLVYYRYGLVSGVSTITYLVIGINMLSVFGESIRRFRMKRRSC